MADLKTLEDAIKVFDKDSTAILYSPNNCYLAIFDGENFHNEHGIISDISSIYEARVFNAEKEFRWLNESNGTGKSVIISDETYPKHLEKLNQNYLLWGKSTGKTSSDRKWTQFAEARVGAFYIPLANVAEDTYAQFTTVEYLQGFEYGNVAVIDERIMGISEVK